MDTIKIWMTKQDADMVDKIFHRTQEPKFTVVKKIDLGETDEYKFIEVEMAFESSMSLWYLAQQVYMELDFDRRMKESIENAKKLIESKIKETKQKHGLD